MKDKSAWHLFLLPTAPRSTVHLPERVPWQVQRHTRWPVCYHHMPEIPSKVSDKAVLPAWRDRPTALPPCYSPLPVAVPLFKHTPLKSTALGPAPTTQNSLELFPKLWSVDHLHQNPLRGIKCKFLGPSLDLLSQAR